MSQSVGRFAEIMAGVRDGAAHLEMRDFYGVEDEMEHFAAFRRGAWDMAAERADRRAWLDLVAETVARGVAVRRARIVSTEVSDYIRYEYAGTQMNIEAGEQVRWLPRHQASDLGLPGNDFWLFDDKLVQFNVFDGQGRWVGTDFNEDRDVVRLCKQAFESVWERAVPHERFAL
jgi:hypothetical protein